MKYLYVGLFASLGASICHLVMVYIFVVVYDWGLEGVAISSSLLFFIRFLLAQVFMLMIKPLQEVKDVYFLSGETF